MLRLNGKFSKKNPFEMVQLPSGGNYESLIEISWVSKSNLGFCGDFEGFVLQF